MSAVTTKPKHCDLASIGYSVEGDDADRIEAVFNLYLIDFIAPCDCILCGKQLGGLMGTFTWGLVHGEGFCGNCKWPARGKHIIADTDGSELGTLNMILQYHPKLITSEGFDELISVQDFQSEVDRIKELNSHDQ